MTKAEIDAFFEAVMPRRITHKYKPEDLPNPRQWHSELREYDARPLTKHDHTQVLECIHLIGKVERTGMTVLARMELASALMASACTSAYESAAAQGQPADGPERFSHSEDFIVRRAREIYAQGRA
jgi:hypothetical protein